jgi:hypothetical protein
LCPGAYYFGAATYYDRLMQTWFKNKINVVQILPWGGFDPVNQIVSEKWWKDHQTGSGANR